MSVVVCPDRSSGTWEGGGLRSIIIFMGKRRDAVSGAGEGGAGQEAGPGLMRNNGTDTAGREFPKKSTPWP